MNQSDVSEATRKVDRRDVSNCTGQILIAFASPDDHLREIEGFQLWSSLCRIEVASSFDKIGNTDFLGCVALDLVVIRPGCRMRKSERHQQTKGFLIYEDDVKMNSEHAICGTVLNEDQSGK
jgi:hypothetical protein